MKVGSTLLTFVFIFLLNGCGTPGPANLERRNVEEFYLGSGVVKYFLPEIPMWANYSFVSDCIRRKSVKYVDVYKLRGSFDLSYHQALQFQYMFNKEIEKVKDEAAVKYLPFQDEEKLFYYVSDKIQSRIFSFQVPSYRRVHLVWIDEALKSKEKMRQFKGLMKSSVMDRGHPVLLSLCLSYDEMEEFVKEQSLQNKNVKLLSYEMLSPYSPQNKLTPRVTIDFGKIFKQSQDLHFFVPQGKEVPENYLGKYKAIHFY